MSGFSNGTVYGSNVDFTGNTQPTPQIISNGQLLIGSTTSPNIRAGSLTSSDSSINITVGAGTIDLRSSSALPNSFTTDSGTANPSGNVLKIVGGNGLNTTGSSNIVTVSLPSAASTGVILRASGTNWVATTTTYPTTTTINQILYSSSASVVAGLTTANSAVLTTTSSGIPQLTTLATDGQLIIGSTAGAPAAATLSAGTGITITNASNSITISSSSSGFSWTDVTGATQTIAAENGYITDRGGGVTYTLPASGSLGDTFIIVGKSGIATITPLALQQLLIGSVSGTAGITGTAVSNNAGDCITFVCTTSGSSTVWRATSVVGNWTLS